MAAAAAAAVGFGVRAQAHTPHKLHKISHCSCLGLGKLYMYVYVLFGSALCMCYKSFIIIFNSILNVRERHGNLCLAPHFLNEHAGTIIIII